jgi:putative SOS response-associated peptidase YedK
MVVILPDGQYSAWLNATQDESRDFLLQYPAELLHVVERG